MLPCGVLIDKIAGQYPPVIISRLQRISDSASATSAAIRNANPLQRPDFRSSESIRPGNSGEPRAISVMSVKRRWYPSTSANLTSATWKPGSHISDPLARLGADGVEAVSLRELARDAG